jgi:hypothetical protein
METFHHANILIHIICGTLALLIGLAVIIMKKGNATHVRYGRYFMRLVVVVIITALIGVLIFSRNNFLLVITFLSGYTCFSGIRTMQLRGLKLKYIDYLVPLIVMGSALYYLYYISVIGMYWAPSVTYSTIGALFMVTVYDLSKKFISVNLLKKAYLYEHVYKMVSALIALLSAFAATVLPDYKPYSQLLPSVFGFAYIFITFMKLSNKPLKSIIGGSSK